MQMKKITLLLMVFALAWSGQLKAVTLPETSKDGKVKWYFIQSMRQDYGEPMFYTVDGDLIRGRVIGGLLRLRHPCQTAMVLRNRRRRMVHHHQPLRRAQARRGNGT